MVARSCGGRLSLLLVLFAFFLSLYPQHDAEARRRRGGGRFRRGAAMRVNNGKKRGGQRRMVANQIQGQGRNLVGRNGLAVDQNGNEIFNGQIQPVVFNGRTLDIGRTRDGRFFPLNPGVARDGQLLVDPADALAGRDALIRTRNGFVSGFDSAGRPLRSNVVQSIQFLESGGLQ